MVNIKNFNYIKSLCCYKRSHSIIIKTYKDSGIQESITRAEEIHSYSQYQCLISQIYTQKPIKRQSDCPLQKCLMKASLISFLYISNIFFYPRINKD